MTEIALPDKSPEVYETFKHRHRVPLFFDLTYTLHSDRVVVTGASLWVPKLEMVIWLRTLSPNTSTVWGRSYHSKWSIAFLICVVAVSVFLLRGPGPATPTVLIFCLALLFAAIAYALWSRALIRYTHFMFNESVNTLSIGDAGPDIERYESFIEELSRRIEGIRKSQK
ncbi:MAG: hypothetical protein DWH81_07355 [Planctomycetota bacterium]|nr:MAG: hypothetical protein DWH81_07355 [Planctomycetota bacterium]